MHTLRTQSFAELHNAALYAILRLRFDIFVVEQQSIYDEYDGLDQQAWHISLWAGEQLAAYVRVYAENEAVTVLGRVVVDAAYRGQGLGRKIVQAGVDVIAQKWPRSVIRIGAQIHLEGFYSSLGFQRMPVPPYDDGGIMHIKMARSSTIADS